MIHMGIDPGASGGIALVSGTRGLIEEVFPFKNKTLADQWRFFDQWAVRATIEHVHSMPHDGRASAFKFGKSYGNLEAFLALGKDVIDE